MLTTDPDMDYSCSHEISIEFSDSTAICEPVFLVWSMGRSVNSLAQVQSCDGIRTSEIILKNVGYSAGTEPQPN